jgi:hypothetical protein
MKSRLFIIALLLPLSALAQQGNHQAQQQARLEQMKAIESASHQERIRILQQADTCIRAATTMDAYRNCEESEHNAREASKEQDRSKKDALRAQFRGQHEQRPAPRS